MHWDNKVERTEKELRERERERRRERDKLLGN